MNAVALLRALRREVPAARPSLTLTVELNLCVGFTEHPDGSDEPKFFEAVLDSGDLGQDPDAVAREVAQLRRDYLARGK